MNKIEKEFEIKKAEIFLKVKDKIEGKVIQEIWKKAEKLEKLIDPLPNLNFKEIRKMKKQCLDFILTLEILEATRNSNDFETLREVFEENEIVEIMGEIK